MTLWEILKANKTGIAPDMFTMLAASKMNGGRDRLHELSGTPPLSFTAKGKPLTAWSITGNTVQNGTPTPDTPQEVKAVGERTGNLFDKNTITAGNFATVSGTVANKSYYCSDFIPITATTYYFQNAVGKSYQNTVVVYDVNKQGLRYENLSGSKKASGAIAFQSGDAYIRINCYYQTDVDTVMVNIGSTALPYEPYGYKIPVVTRGKNLLGNYEIFSGYYYDDSGTPTSSDARFIRLIINVEPNTIYTISSNLKFYSIWEFNNNTKISRRGGNNSNKYTIKTAKECNSLRISMINTSGEADTSAFEWIQLEEGTTATPYEPYHEPITTPIYLDSPLYKIGDYADRLSKTEEVRVVKELVLTGKENFSYDDTYTRFTLKIPNARATSNRRDETPCTHYISIHDGRSIYDIPDDSIYVTVGGGYVYINIKDITYTSLADFKSYLAAQYAAGTPVKVYYVMKTPETKTVEPVEIPTLNGTTVIDVDTVVKPESMTIKYRR